MEKVNLKNIEMMNDLLTQAEKIRKDQINSNKESKEEMLLKARKKLRDYFDEVLRVLPFEHLNVTVSEGIEIYLRKSDDDYNAINSHPTADIINKKPNVAIFAHKGYSGYKYPIQSEYEKRKWGSSSLYTMTPEALIVLVQNFDLIKQKVEEKIAKEIEVKIQQSAKRVNREANELDALSNFLN
jgi:hypothetical protein